MKTEATRFVEEMLRWIRREFFAQHTEKRFFQERSMLIQAITWPAKWMHDRAVNSPDSIYRRILGTVIQTIKRHGNREKIQRFSAYFLHSVQEHMKHQGDQYYYMAKEARPISAILPAVTRHVRPGRATDSVTETLSQMNQVLRSPGGRRRRIQSGSEDDLFGSCKRDAAHVQDRGNDSQTFAVPAEKSPELLTPRSRPSLTASEDS